MDIIFDDNEVSIEVTRYDKDRKPHYSSLVLSDIEAMHVANTFFEQMVIHADT